jgi:hypothetical protein
MTWTAKDQPTSSPSDSPAHGSPFPVAPATSTAIDEARKIRVAWMTEMGMDAEEIGHHMRADPPTDPAAEQRELDAVRRVKATTPSVEQLLTIAVKCE